MSSGRVFASGAPLRSSLNGFAISDAFARAVVTKQGVGSYPDDLSCEAAPSR